jgi:hypothetical protein
LNWIEYEFLHQVPPAATGAFEEMSAYGFKAVTTWRRNSQNSIFEQDQQWSYQGA